VGSILLVESDPDTRDRLGSAVKAAGHEVITAATAREAFLRVSEGGIDAVVIDSYDPRVGVVELSKHIDTLPDAPPLVLVSASPHAPEISARIGAAAFLPKPLDPGELVHALSRVVGEVRPVRQLEPATSVEEAANVDDFAHDEEPTGPTRVFQAR
jgi:two-component system chemotaxis response regulator CheY